MALSTSSSPSVQGCALPEGASGPILAKSTTNDMTDTQRADLMDGNMDWAASLIHAATEAGDDLNAIALYEEWQDYLTAGEDEVCEVVWVHPDAFLDIA